MATVKRTAEAGHGIVALPAYICRDDVRSGRLVRILPDWVCGESRVTALMPHRRGMTAAARAFIDHIAAAFPVAMSLNADTKKPIALGQDVEPILDTRNAVRIAVAG